MTGFIIMNRRTTRYLERCPADGAWTWLAPFPREATVFSPCAAQAMAKRLLRDGEDVVIVPTDRAPEIVDLESVPA